MRMNVLILCCFLMLGGPAWAGNPTGIKLEYDFKKKALHVEIEHLTHNVRHHRIRKIVVTKNHEEPLEFFFTRQDNEGLTADLSIAAAGGDVLKVEAFCSKGGYAEEKITVPKEVAP